jgi:hypothetical protein
METSRCIIQGLVTDKMELPPHCLDEYMGPKKAAKKNSKLDSPAHGTYVYTDDFIGAAVESRNGTLLGHMARCIMHGIHAVFPLPDITSRLGGKDPVSIKKLEGGDGQRHHEKEILGFIINGDAKTIQISASKVDGLVHEIRRIHKRNVSN